MYHRLSFFDSADVCIDCVMTRVVAVYISGGHYTLIHHYDISAVERCQLMCFRRVAAAAILPLFCHGRYLKISRRCPIHYGLPINIRFRHNTSHENDTSCREKKIFLKWYQNNLIDSNQ